MMYGNPYGNYNFQQQMQSMPQAAQPFMQPMDQLAQLRAMQTPAPQSQAQGCITWVQGEEGAKAYLVAAGNSVLLMDSEAKTFYVKSTDVSGMPLPLRIFDYTEREAHSKAAAQTPAADYVTREEFNKLSAKIDRLNRDLGVEEGTDNG